MKFKHLIILFSILIVLMILLYTLLPLVIASPASDIVSEVTDSPLTNFRYITLPLLILMFILLLCMSTFFIYNYRLFSLLEREDWPALAYYLEQKIYVKGRYNARYVRLLASSYLVISDYNSVLTLESKAILANKSSVIEKNALIFGAARVLSGNHDDAADFFKTHMEKEKNNQWLRWFYGFSFLLAGKFDSAMQEFAPLTVSSRSAIITGISAYFLNNAIAKNCENLVECLSASESGRSRVVKSIKSADGWKKEADKISSEIHVAIIRKYIDEAGNWLFPADSL